MEYEAAELAKSTGGYCRHNLLGRGGYGSVYKGRVRDCLDVAIKVLTQVRLPGECVILLFLLLCYCV